MERNDFDDVVDLIEKDKKWRIKREISLGDLIAICSAIVAVFVAWATLNTRLTITEERVGAQRLVDERQDADALRFRAEMFAAVERMNAKLDRLMERRAP